MGGESAVITSFWASLMPDSVSYVAESPAFVIPNAPPGRKKVWLCDIPGWLMSRSSPTLQGRAYTFGDWLNHCRAKLELYFKDIEVETVVAFLDIRSDPAKGVLRQKDDSASEKPSVPLTPANGWESYLIEQSRQYHDHAASFVHQETFPPLEILLPGEDDNSQGKFCFTDYMANREFKYGFFVPFICKYLLKDFVIGAGKTVILRGKNTALGFRDGVVFELSEDLVIPYTEADCIIGKYAALFKQHTVYVDSPDFDVVSNCLLTADLRLLKRAFETRIDLEPNPALRENSTVTRGANDGSTNKFDIFTNQVYVVRGQWPTRRPGSAAAKAPGKNGKTNANGAEDTDAKSTGTNTVVDINQLFLGIHAMAADLRKTYNVKIRNPVGDQVLLAMLCGRNDYIDKSLLPGIASAAMFNGYFGYCRYFPSGLVTNHMQDGRFVGYNVDVVALSMFVRAAYVSRFRELSKTVLFSNAVDDFRAIGVQLARGKATCRPDIAIIRQLAVTCTWTLNWYSICCYDQTPSESTQRVAGRSQFGWTWHQTPLSNKQEVVQTSDVSIDWLLALTNPEYRPECATNPALVKAKPKLQAPRPQTYSQFDLVN